MQVGPSMRHLFTRWWMRFHLLSQSCLNWQRQIYSCFKWPLSRHLYQFETSSLCLPSPQGRRHLLPSGMLAVLDGIPWSEWFPETDQTQHSQLGPSGITPLRVFLNRMTNHSTLLRYCFHYRNHFWWFWWPHQPFHSHHQFTWRPRTGSLTGWIWGHSNDTCRNVCGFS